MTKVNETYDYSMFKIVDYNRPLDANNLKKIKASLQANNLLEMCPIIVNGAYEIIDGQHRLEAAKQLGISIWYVINRSSSDEDIILLNAAKKTWTMEDYLNYYVNKGNAEYLKCLEFCKKHNTTVRHVLRVYLGSDGGNATKAFKSGMFKFPKPEKLMEIERHIEQVKTIQEVIEKYCFGRKIVLKSPYLLKALHLLVSLPELNLEVLCKKIAQKAEIVRSCGSVGSYYQLFLDIYNYRNPSPIIED